MKLRFFRSVLMSAAILGLGATAAASTITGGGLSVSYACPNGSSSCSSSSDFTLDPPSPAAPASGSIVFGGGTATIMLTVPSFSMTGSSGSVTGLDFTNVVYSAVVPISVFDLGGGMEQIQQSAPVLNGSVQGTYDQIGGPGSGPFGDLSVSFTDLSCLLVNGQGTCGFNVGAALATGDLALDVDGAAHDVVQAFNVVVPEPGSLGLLALGLLGLSARRRQPPRGRHQRSSSV